MEFKARYCNLWLVFLTLASTVSKAGPYRAGVESQDLYWSKRMSCHRAWLRNPGHVFHTARTRIHSQDSHGIAQHICFARKQVPAKVCRKDHKHFSIFLKCDRWISSVQTSQTKLKLIRVSYFRRFKTDMSAVMSARCSRVLIQTFHQSKGYWVNMLHCLHYLTSTQNLQTVQMSTYQNMGWRLIIAEDKLL